MRVEVIKNYSNRQTDEDGALLDLLLSTVAPHQHINVHKAVNEVGVVAAISDIVTKYWDHKQKEEAVDEVRQWVKLDDEDGNAFKGVYVKILVDAFAVDKHLNQATTHRKFIAKTFRRFGRIFPNISEKQISEHDLSKYSFIEMIGYTDRWVWGVSSPAWHTALQHHYTNNPHHPQHQNIANNNNTSNNEDNKSSNKEANMSSSNEAKMSSNNEANKSSSNEANMSSNNEANKSSNNEANMSSNNEANKSSSNEANMSSTNKANMSSNNEANMSSNNEDNKSSSNEAKMCLCHLEESVVDMMACHWERSAGGREGATAEEIADFGGVFLERYGLEERRLVEELLQRVRNSDL